MIERIPDEVASDAQADRDPVERLAEEFLDSRRKGVDVSISDYAQRHPELAQRIRDLFPTLLLMEEFKPSTTASHVGASRVVPAEYKTLEQLGDFHILREIGRGGMGVVFEAEQESLGRRVALKVLPAGYVASPNRLRRFHREAQAAARLHHTNIVPIFGVGEQAGVHYYVMQFIPGQGLDRVLAALDSQPAGAIPPSSKRQRATAAPPAPTPQAPAAGPPSAEDAEAETNDSQSATGSFPPSAAARMLRTDNLVPEAALSASGVWHANKPVAAGATAGRTYWRNVARIGVQVADALHYAHQQGILHRDIKPANLLLDNRGIVWIADFGLAKLADLDDLTHSGDVVGTLRYMAPEQFAGEADARGDVYSLGLTLYELLTLQPAFPEKDRGRLIRQITQEEPPRPGKLNPAIPADLETIVVKAIAAHPAHRYPTAAELADDLRCFLEDRPVRARRATWAGRAWRWCRRNRAVAVLGSTALALLAAIALVTSVAYVHTTHALQRVSTERQRAEDALHQADEERAKTRAERERAEANLHLAVRAFEEIFAKVASVEPVALSSDQGDDEEMPQPATQAVVTGKEAAMLESMLKFYDQFAQQNQADVKLQKETARASRWVGDIQRRLGQHEKAEAAYRHALATYQHLAETSPENTENPSTALSSPAERSGSEYLTAIAAIHNELGVLFRSTGRFGEARTAHQTALQTLRKQSSPVAALPESRFELAKTYDYLSTVMHGPGPGPRGKPSGGRRGPWPVATRGQEAIDYSSQALEILQALVNQSPDNTRYRLTLARCQRDRYLLLSFSGRKDEAQGAKQEAIGILEKLTADLPQNPEFRYELAETYILSPPPFRGAPVPEDAAAQFDRAVEIGNYLVAAYPAVPEYRAMLAQSLSRLADVQMARRQWPQARKTLEEAIACSKKLQDPAPNRHFAQMMAMGQYAALAKVLRELGETAGADEAAAKAVEAGSHRGHAPFSPHHHDRPGRQM